MTFKLDLFLIFLQQHKNICQSHSKNWKISKFLFKINLYKYISFSLIIKCVNECIVNIVFILSKKKKNARNQPDEENSKWLRASWGIVPDSWAAMQIFLK